MVTVMPREKICYKTVHPEDIKAAIRRKFGTILKFEKHYALPSTGVSDLLREKSHNPKTISAVEAILADRHASINLENSTNLTENHGLNEKAA
ncbi:conserved hypothetical protein [Sphingorhabdus sp. 109]|nr:conserved hypothetical protein [Sphingorhabdus sp. 109]